MIERPRRMTAPKSTIWWLGLLALSASLVAIGVWLDQQFDASSGPVRHSSPEVVVWVSLAAVGLVLVLWGIVEMTARRASRGGRS